MAQLLLIKSTSERDNRQPGDIIGIFHDLHVFSDQEKKVFDIVKVPDTKEAVEALRPALDVRPVVRTKDNQWTFEEEADHAEVWRSYEQDDFKMVIEPPRFDVRYEAGQIKENYSRDAKNLSAVSIDTKQEAETKG